MHVLPASPMQFQNQGKLGLNPLYSLASHILEQYVIYSQKMWDKEEIAFAT